MPAITNWLDEHSFKLHNKPGVHTFFPRSSTIRNPTVIDLSFSRGAISTYVDSWIIDHESTSDHSIIGLNLNLPITEKFTIAANELVHAWEKTDWGLFRSTLADVGMDFTNIG